MNYELALQLKEAGFPHEFSFNVYDEAPMFPTLEEVIEACGDGCDTLFRIGELKDKGVHVFDKGWYARNGDDSINAFGETPLEAVCKLWLELNKK